MSEPLENRPSRDGLLKIGYFVKEAYMGLRLEMMRDNFNLTRFRDSGFECARPANLYEKLDEDMDVIWIGLDPENVVLHCLIGTSDRNRELLGSILPVVGVRDYRLADFARRPISGIFLGLDGRQGIRMSEDLKVKELKQSISQPVETRAPLNNPLIRDVVKVERPLREVHLDQEQDYEQEARKIGEEEAAALAARLKAEGKIL